MTGLYVYKYNICHYYSTVPEKALYYTGIKEKKIMALIRNDEFIKAWLIYLKDGRAVLSRKHYESWWEIQDEFGSEFKANRAITEIPQVLRYMKADFPEGAAPFTGDMIEAFFDGTEEQICGRADGETD